MKKLFTKIFALIILLGGIAHAQIASGGGFTLEQTVIASGGGKSSGGGFLIEGTNAQAVAGTRSINSNLNLHGGFWNSAQFAPTAAKVSVGGRILTAENQGIRNVSVSLTDGNGTIHTMITGSFGFYNFAEIEAGQTVVIRVQAKRFTFAQPSIVLNVAENVGEINFIANE